MSTAGPNTYRRSMNKLMDFTHSREEEVDQNSCTKLHRRLILNFIQPVGSDLYIICTGICTNTFCNEDKKQLASLTNLSQNCDNFCCHQKDGAYFHGIDAIETLPLSFGCSIKIWPKLKTTWIVHQHIFTNQLCHCLLVGI